MKKMGGFLALVVPGGLVSAVFIFIPVVVAILLSFFRLETILSTPVFVGLANFRDVLGQSEFWWALVHGVVYAGLAVIVQLSLGLVFALVLNERFLGARILRGAVIFPYVIPTVVGVQLWRWMLDENVGIVSSATKSLGLHISWFSTPTSAMFSVILISVWLWTPFVTMCLLAGLQSTSDELLEAARSDGAGTWARFWHVTLPALRPILIVVGLLRAIWMFNKFDVIFLTTGGGPLHSTEHLPILAYQMAFGSFQLGDGAAVSTINVLFLLALVVLYLRLTRRATEAVHA